MKKYIFNVSCKLYWTLELELEDNYTEEEAIKAIQDKIDNDSEYQLLQNLETERLDIYKIIDLPHIFDNRKNQIPKRWDKFECWLGIWEVLWLDSKNQYVHFKLNWETWSIHLWSLWGFINQEKWYF